MRLTGVLSGDEQCRASELWGGRVRIYRIHSECQADSVSQCLSGSVSQCLSLTVRLPGQQLHSTHGVHQKAPNKHILRLSNDPEQGVQAVGAQWHNDGSFETAVFSNVGYLVPYGMALVLTVR